MANESIAERVQELAERVAIDHGLELVHAEVAGPENKPIVRIFIDKPNGCDPRGLLGNEHSPGDDSGCGRLHSCVLHPGGIVAGTRKGPVQTGRLRAVRGQPGKNEDSAADWRAAQFPRPFAGSRRRRRAF